MFAHLGKAARVVGLASRRFYRDDCFDRAALIAFYSLLSLIPLLLLMISFGAWVLGSADVASAGVWSLAQSVIQDLDPGVVRQARQTGLEAGHEWAFFLIALWTASRVFTKIQSSLDRILRVVGGRSYPLQTLIVFAAVAFLGVVLVSMIVVESGMSLIERRVADSTVGWLVDTPLYSWLDHWVTRYLIPWGTTVLAFLMIYRFLPAKPPRGATLLLSALAAGTLWEVMKFVFSYYVGNMANYSRTYGTLEAVVVFLVWVQLSSSVLLWGAELAAVMNGVPDTLQSTSG